jgi:hypothetical protein
MTPFQCMSIPLRTRTNLTLIKLVLISPGHLLLWNPRNPLTVGGLTSLLGSPLTLNLYHSLAIVPGLEKGSVIPHVDYVMIPHLANLLQLRSLH